MDVVESLVALRAWRAAVTGSLGFVPTMGALHEGHLSLVRRARDECKRVVVSIFVNPAQFGPHEDFERYPRDLARDLAPLGAEGVELVFTPTPALVYPTEFSTWVTVVVPTWHCYEKVHFTLTVIDVDNQEAFAFLKRLAQVLYRSKQNWSPAYDDVKQLAQFMWSVHTGWSFIDGYTERDVIAEMIDAI